MPLEDNRPMPEYQTSLMQMSSNQYYLVVQINFNETAHQLKNVYENYP